MPGSLSVIIDDPRFLGAAEALCTTGVDCHHDTPETLAAAIVGGSATAALIDVQTLKRQDWHLVEAAVAGQPIWSALPFILMVDRVDRGALADAADRLINVVPVEPPVDAALLAHVARTAIRARKRQRRSGRLIADSLEIEARLEQDVRARTADLHAANLRLLNEAEERLGVEHRLRESEEMYRYTVELTNQLAWTASTELRVETISETFRRITGLAEKLHPHEGFVAVVHPDDLGPTLEAWRVGAAGRKPASAEFRIRMADGTYRLFHARAVPRLDENGEIVRWYGYTEDIQQQREAEHARRTAEERYRLAARATNDAIWELDLQTQTVQWSETSGDALGLHDAAPGITSVAWWEERVHSEDRQIAIDSLRQALSEGQERWSGTYRWRQPDGSYRHYYDRGFIMRDERGEAVRIVGAMSDITPQLRAQEEVSRMQAELIHVSRVSAMGTMASTLAHELNQPLTVVTNYLRGIRRMTDMDEIELNEFRHALALAESGALRAGQIVRRLRELVARGTAAIRREDLLKLIEDAGVIAFLDAHVLGIVPRVHLDPDARCVEADRIQIQQVIINLVRNAVQAVQSRERREVIIRASRISPAQVQICVEDSGSGLPAQVRDALFSPFQTTKPDGMGIGLSICRTIIEAHGGKIWAEDREGGGTVFCFTLPAIDPDS